MVGTCEAFTDTVLHQTGQGRQNVDRRVDRLSMKLTVQYDLALGDISGKVRNRVGDVVVWHGQDRDLGYRTGASTDDSRTLVKSCQFTVQISRITFSGRNLTFGGGNLSHSLAEGGDVSQDNQDVHAFFKSKIFSSSEGNLRCQKTLYNRVVGKVQKHYNVVGSTAFLEGPAEEFGYVVFNAHCCKNNSEFLIGVCAKGSLLNDLCSQLVMRKTVSGKDRQLLAADQGG